MDPQKGEMTLVEIARARGLSPVAWDDREEIKNVFLHSK